MTHTISATTNLRILQRKRRDKMKYGLESYKYEVYIQWVQKSKTILAIFKSGNTQQVFFLFLLNNPPPPPPPKKRKKKLKKNKKSRGNVGQFVILSM